MWSVGASASGGATDSVTLSFALSSPGLLHYEVVTAGSAGAKDGAALKGASVSGKVIATGSITVSDTKDDEYLVNGLTAGTAYDVYVVSETAKSGGVFSAISERMSVSTHAVAPKVGIYCMMEGGGGAGGQISLTCPGRGRVS